MQRPVERARRAVVSAYNYLAKIPLFSKRSQLIAGLTGVPVLEVSILSGGLGVDICELEKELL